MLQDHYKALFALVILVTWQMAGYMMIIYITGLNNIPTDLYEAAEMDGANAFQRFRVITLPMLMPAITIVFFLTLANCFKLLDQNIALTDGNFDTRLLATQILRTTRDTSPPDLSLIHISVPKQGESPPVNHLFSVHRQLNPHFFPVRFS